MEGALLVISDDEHLSYFLLIKYFDWAVYKILLEQPSRKGHLVEPDISCRFRENSPKRFLLASNLKNGIGI